MKASTLFKLFLLLIILTNCFVSKANYQEQELVTITNNETLAEKEMRKLAPNRKQYPILDEFEKQLYPGRNFHKDKPDERLKRIEIAVFGSVHETSIKSRLRALELELESWEIAQAKIPAKNSQAKNAPKLKPEIQNYPQYQRPMASQIKFQQAPKKQVDYDYLNYRMMSSLAQSTVRRGIGRMFSSK